MKIGTKIFTTIFCSSFIAAVTIFGVSAYESTNRAIADANSTLLWASRDYADKFNSNFKVIEDQLFELEILVGDTLDYNSLKADSNAYLTNYENILAPKVKDFAKRRTDSISGWVYFDPKFSTSPHDIYYVDEDGDGIADRQEYIQFSYYNNIPEENDDKQWWYGPISTHKTFWTNPYEWKLANGTYIKVVSCAKPVYINDEFICVIGTYYHFDDMYKEIKSISIYKNDYAALYNEKLDVIIHPEYFSGTRFTSDNLYTVDDGNYKYLADEIAANEYGVANLKEDNVDRIISYAKLSNGWTFAISPTLSEIYSPVYSLFYKLLISVLACLVFSLLVALFMGRYLSRPIIKICDATRIIGTGDLSFKIDVKSKDETKILANSINEMINNITTLESDLYKQANYDDLTGARNLRKFKVDAQKNYTII